MIMTLPFCIMTSSLRLVNYKKWICKLKIWSAKYVNQPKIKRTMLFINFDKEMQMYSKFKKLIQ